MPHFPPDPRTQLSTDEEVVVNWPLVYAAFGTLALVGVLLAVTVALVARHQARPVEPVALREAPRKEKKVLWLPTPAVNGEALPPLAAPSTTADESQSAEAEIKQATPPARVKPVLQIVIMNKPKSQSKRPVVAQPPAPKEPAPEPQVFKRRDHRSESQLLELLVSQSREVDLDLKSDGAKTSSLATTMEERTRADRPQLRGSRRLGNCWRSGRI